MKIFVLGTRGFPEIQGGIEKHCEQLYPRLINAGCKVTVAVRKPYMKNKGRMKCWEGVQFRNIVCPRMSYLEAAIHTFLGVFSARMHSADIVHIHGVGPSLFVPLAKLLRLRVVMTHHGPDYKRKKWGAFGKRVLKLGEYLGVKLADKIIVISQPIKEALEGRFKREDLIYIPNGVNCTGRMSVRRGSIAKFNLKTGEYVFTACRFVPEKGLHDLIDAYNALENPPFKLVIAGDVDHETSYSRKLKKKARKNKNIVLVGIVTGHLLEKLYSHAGLFVLPSYYEGLPFVLLEALSFNVPVLASDIPANRQIGLEGFRFYPPGNVGKLAEKISELFNKGISEQEKQKYYVMLQNNYQWKNIAEKTYQVYKSLNCS